MERKDAGRKAGEEANFALDAAIVSLSFFGFITHVRISWAFVYAFFCVALTHLKKL